jgi:hypothetical protein
MSKLQDNTFENKNYSLPKYYNLKNTFLTEQQKAVVEAWYQFPLGIFEILLFSSFIFWSDVTIWKIILYSYLFGLLIAFLNWRFINNFFIKLGYLVGGNASTLICIGFAIYFGFNSQWLFMIIAILSSLGLIGIISPSVVLYSILSINKGHPKYIFAKKYFNINF